MTLRLNGATSGSVSLDAPATGSNVSLELPTDSIKPGMVLVAAQSFSAASSVSVNNCFSATYTNYRVMIELTASTDTANTGLRLRVSGADDTATNYAQWGWYAGSITAAAINSTGLTSWVAPFAGSNIRGMAAYDLSCPGIATTTTALAQIGQVISSQVTNVNVVLRHGASTAYDGITFFTGTGTITGSLRVYGYRNSL